MKNVRLNNKMDFNNHYSMKNDLYITTSTRAEDSKGKLQNAKSQKHKKTELRHVETLFLKRSMALAKLSL